MPKAGDISRTHRSSWCGGRPARNLLKAILAGVVVLGQVLLGPTSAGASTGHRSTSPRTMAVSDDPEMVDILECGWGMVGGVLTAGSSAAVKKALEFFDRAKKTLDLWTAVEVYGTNPDRMTPEETVDLAMIFSALASCARVSPPLSEAINGILEELGLPTAFAPTPPTGLTVVAVSPTAMKISWIDGSGDETGFEVNNGEVSAMVGPGVTSYTWTGLSPGSYMCVHVRALNGPRSSAWEPADAPYYRCTTTPASAGHSPAT